MKSCKICKNEDCTWSGHTGHISVGCLGFEPQTNADRIRAMTDKELAKAICRLELLLAKQGHRGFQAWLDWLRQEAGG